MCRTRMGAVSTSRGDYALPNHQSVVPHFAGAATRSCAGRTVIIARLPAGCDGASGSGDGVGKLTAPTGRRSGVLAALRASRRVMGVVPAVGVVRTVRGWVVVVRFGWCR